MSVSARSLVELDHSYASELPQLSVPWTAAPVSTPALLMLNEELATELGLDAEALREPAGVALLVGNAVPEEVQPVAQAYAGHQFGVYVPRLGDGRALLLGELIDGGRRRADAARVRDGGGVARAGHPHQPGAGGGGHRRPGRAGDAAARRGARAGRGEASACGHVPVRGCGRGP